MQKVIMDVPSLSNPQNVVNGSIASALIIKAYKNAIFIRKNATNGDVIKAMFPDVEVKEKNNGIEVYFGIGTAIQFFNHQWWNAKYKAESESRK